MKQKLLNLTRLRSLLLLACVMLGVSAWGDPTVLFHETFGNNTGSARTWDNSYSVKSGVESVYSGITGYTITNAKQSKNTTGSTQSGLIQSSQDTDAELIVGPLNVEDYSSLKVTYQWKAASIKGTYSTSLYYATSPTGSYSEITGTGAGATTFVERSYSLPEAAQVSTLYLKIIWKTSNTQAIIDELELTGIDGSISTLAESDFALTGAPVALTFDLYNNSSAQTIIYTTSSTGAVTVSGGTGYVTTSVNESAKTITVTPTAKTSSAQTITVSQAADDTYAAGEATFTVSVDDSTPFTGGVVTFDATTDKGTSPLSKDPVTMSCSYGLLNNGTEYRFYKNSETTFSVPEGYYISQIVFTNADDDNPCSNLARKNGTSGEYTNNTWTGASRAATFVASAQARASEIQVTVVSGDVPPVISAENVNINSDAIDGSITVTIQNEPDGGQLSASSSASWLIIGTINENTVPFTCSANTATTSRQTTVTLTYTYNTNQTVTTTVSVTQAAYVAPFTPSTYTLVNEITSGKHYIITSAVTDDGYVKAMGAQNSNNRAAVEVEVTGNTANVNSADVSEFVIYGPDANDRYAIYDPTTGGYLYAASRSSNSLKTQASNNVNGQWSISFSNNVASIVADVSSNRNVMQYNSSSDGLFSCYASDSQSPVYLYVKSDEATPSVPVSITSAGLATFSSINAVDFTDADAVEVYTATVGTDGKITYNSISKVPANTGVVLRSTEGNSVNISVPTLSGGADVIAANDLVAVSQTIEQLASTNEDGTTNYILNIVNDKLGFYKANNKKVAAGKAYLKAGVDESRSFIGVDDMTGIESIAATVSDGQYYDLQGRRVAQPQKGLYIVNGKKVIIK